MKNHLNRLTNGLGKFCNLGITFLSIALMAVQLNLQAGNTDHSLHGMGAKPLTQEQLQDILANWPRVLAVKPNKIGAARIQKHLQDLGQVPGIIEIASTSDEEFVTNKNTTGETLEDLNAKWGISSLPASVDNSKLPCFPPIGDQGAEGSCVGFATTYYHATHEYGFLNGINNKTSSAGIRSPKWTYNMINGGSDAGSWPTDGYNLLNKNGAVSINSFPYDSNYTQWDLNTQDWISALTYRMAPVNFITINSSSDIDVIKGLLNNGHVVTFTTYASWHYTTVQADPSTPNNPYVGQDAVSWASTSSGGHHTTVVGYDDNVWIDINGNGTVDSGEKGAFLIANSWGTGYANAGFVWMSYDAFYKTSQVVNGPGPGRIALADMFYSIVPIAANYQPKIVAEFTLTQSDRNQLAMGVADSSTSTTSPSTTIASQALDQSGGSLAFDGGAARSMSATFALDFTDLLPSTSSTQRYYLLATDVAAGNTSTLNAFTLIDLVNNKQVSNPTTPISFDNQSIQPYIDYQFNNNVTPPSVNITSPANGATISKTISVIANVTASAGVSHVDFYVDSTLILSDTTSPYSASVDTTTLSNGAHTFTAIVYDKAGNSAKSIVTVTVDNAQNSSIFINAGNGGAIIDACTNVAWQGDQYYSGGQTYTNSTLPSCLNVYTTERYGNFSYNIPVSNGNKYVILKFAEIFYQTVGARVFNVKINGQQVISNLDIFKEVGFAKPLDLSFPVNVTNNNIRVEFIPVVENPKVCGLEVLSQ